MTKTTATPLFLSEVRQTRGAPGDGYGGSATTPNGTTLGAAGHQANNAPVDIARFLRYSGTHSTAAQDAIIEGLARLYGLSV